MRSKGHSQSMFMKIMASPIRALCKARDAYVRSITNCGNHMSYGNPMDDAGRFSALPRSYSAATSRSGSAGSYSTEDFAELMRAASARTLADKIDVDLVLKQQQNGLPKSCSVGMARIDEDAPCDLGDAPLPVLPPRSRSYAVGVKTNAFF